jgi:hypothetical protein
MTTECFFRSLFSLWGLVEARSPSPRPNPQAEEPVWQLAKIDFHIPFAFSLLLKRINLRAFTENKGCGKQGCHTGSEACAT